MNSFIFVAFCPPYNVAEYLKFVKTDRDRWVETMDSQDDMQGRDHADERDVASIIGDNYF